MRGYIEGDKMKVYCKKCKKVWDYKGNSEYYVTCPKCYNKVNLKSQPKEIYDFPTKEEVEKNLSSNSRVEKKE